MPDSLVQHDPTTPFLKWPRWAERFGSAVLNDPRDLVLLRPIVMATFVLLPSAVGLFLSDRLLALRVALHFAAYLSTLAGFILMVHVVSHRPTTFRRRHRWIFTWVQWGVGPLLAMTPNTYYAHHLEMHHREGNLPTDLSSTMAFQRDSPIGFLKYFLRFLFGIMLELTLYMWRRRRFKQIRRMLFGEFCYYALVIALFRINPVATVVVFVVPFVTTRFLMMLGNFAQHSLIDPDEPTSPYRNTVTCINIEINKWGYNDGYHIGHHLQPALHWLEYPKELARNRDVYAREGAVIFDGVDPLFVWLGLMGRRYEWLARHVVRLGGPMSDADVARMLRARAQPIPAAKRAALVEPVTT